MSEIKEKMRNEFLKSELSFSEQIGVTDNSPSSIIVEMFSDDSTNLPYHIRTGPQSLGDPCERKRYRGVEIHGSDSRGGTCRVRIYIDGRYVCDGAVTFSESPLKHRRVNIPLGRQLGYTIDVEIAGTVGPRAIEISYSGMSSES